MLLHNNRLYLSVEKRVTLMTNADKVYVELQQHLDKLAVGFPATKSGVEIRILKELFNPEQASLAFM